MSKFKTLLLVTYYWPPSGGAGVYRWLKMAKYLPQNGWHTIVVTPENPERPVYDESLQSDVLENQDVLELPIWEPYGVYRRLRGMGRKPVYSHFISSNDEPGLTQTIATWLRGNFLIPDPRRFWIRSTSKQILSKWSNLNVDAVVTTGPPHSLHLIGQKIHRETGVPWVADFRDPWTEVYYFSRLKLSKLAKREHEKLEKSILREATKVVTVSAGWAQDLRRISQRGVDVVRNGFDPADFSSIAPRISNGKDIAHFGALRRERNPKALWSAIAHLKKDGLPSAQDLRVHCYGPVDGYVLASAKSFGVSEQLVLHAYMPHSKAVATMRSSSMLLAINQDKSKGVIPGKLYEYLASRRPILLLGNPSGDAADIVASTGAGSVADINDTQTVELILKGFLSEGQSTLSPDKDLSQFSRREMAKEYAHLLDTLSAE